jgi:hypothetical protein
MYVEQLVREVKKLVDPVQFAAVEKAAGNPEATEYFERELCNKAEGDEMMQNARVVYARRIIIWNKASAMPLSFDKQSARMRRWTRTDSKVRQSRQREP